MATNVCGRLFVTKNLVNLTKKFRPAQRNYSNFRFNAENGQNYVKYLLIVGGGVTAFVCANLFKTKANTVQAFNIKRIKVFKMHQLIKKLALQCNKLGGQVIDLIILIENNACLKEFCEKSIYFYTILYMSATFFFYF